MWEALKRRIYIRRPSVLTSFAFPPELIKQQSKNTPLGQLIAALRHQCTINDTALTDDDVKAMIYSFNKINPRNHLEYAIVTACASKCLYDSGLIDEYVRRKNGKAPKFFYHPVFDLETRCLPNTHGVLFFRDQAVCVLSEITSANTVTATEHWSALMKWELSFYDFIKIVNDKYKKELGSPGLQSMYNFILTCSPYIPYFWNSTIVSKAGL